MGETIAPPKPAREYILKKREWGKGRWQALQLDALFWRPMAWNTSGIAFAARVDGLKSRLELRPRRWLQTTNDSCDHVRYTQ